MSIIVAQIAASTAQSFPGNGQGSVITAFGTDHLSSGSEVYTATTCTTATWPVGGEPNTGTSAGMLVVTQDGYWGSFVSGTATTVTVDKWRTRSGGIGVPTAGQECRILNGTCCAIGTKGIYLHRIIVSRTTASDLTVRDVWGNVLYTHSGLGANAAGTSYTVEFCTGQGEPGLFFDRLVSFQSAAATANATFVFSY